MEDKTRNGEIIPSYFVWLTLDKQKEVVDRLEKATNEEKDK